MPIPSEIQALIDRLNRELDETERKATDGLNILRRAISTFTGNVILVQYLAYLNALLLFVETSRRQIEIIVETLTPVDVPTSTIQESGEDLGTLLGRVLEGKNRVEQILNFLRGLP
jgi:hypothetical protein